MPDIGMIGHNARAAAITVEVRLFNSLWRPDGGNRRGLALPPDSTVGDLVRELGIPRSRIFLVLVNGRDVTRGRVGAEINGEHPLEHGDVVAFSGPVPFSFGYGAPVV